MGNKNYTVEQITETPPSGVVGGTDVYSYYEDKLGYAEEGKVYVVKGDKPR